ncbi:amidohydrolase [Modicisalibacter luteus]|uniref:amidohydrolase n=1 Tax=Modicisalibacter luteus TaxID=453962 RepID=UPI0036419DA4
MMMTQTDMSDLKDAIVVQVEATLEDVQTLYRQIHQHPELPFEEHETSKRLATALETLGYEVTRGVGGTGVVALLRNGEGPTVMLRGDMDALPIKEDTGLEFASTRTAETESGTVPLMHACGHDLHSSCVVGAAAVMARLKEQWSGTLMLICQPAEEIFGGAKAMLDDGLYVRFARPDVILGQHNMPALAGTIGHRPGSTMAACTNLAVTIHGVGGHGSMPAQAVDPVVIAAHAVTRLQNIVSREVPPEETVVVTVGKLQAGTQANIIPHSAELEINIRSFDNALHRQVMEAIERIIRAECEAGRSPRPRSSAYSTRLSPYITTRKRSSGCAGLTASTSVRPTSTPCRASTAARTSRFSATPRTAASAARIFPMFTGLSGRPLQSAGPRPLASASRRKCATWRCPTRLTTSRATRSRCAPASRPWWPEH